MYFETKVNFRIKKTELKLIEEITKLLDERYDNVSHFLRCAAIKLIDEETKNVRAIRKHKRR